MYETGLEVLTVLFAKAAAQGSQQVSCCCFWCSSSILSKAFRVSHRPNEAPAFPVQKLVRAPVTRNCGHSKCCGPRGPAWSISIPAAMASSLFQLGGLGGHVEKWMNVLLEARTSF